MIKYRVPASSANLGIGFDCLGLALNIYNYYKIEESDHFLFEGFIDVKLKDNLFYKAYIETCKYHKEEVKPIHVILNANIPVSRGLGSSSAIIVGGIYAYYYIYKKVIDKKTILEIATRLEGHPDNVAPCIYGGLCSVNGDCLSKLKISNKWHFGILIPSYEVVTAKARKVIKKELALKDAINNISSAIVGLDGLANFDIAKIKKLNNDKIHEPYRKKLIKDYAKCQKEAFSKGAEVFLISGSGSTMLIISSKQIVLNIKDIIFKKVKVDKKGVTCLKNY